MGVDVARGGRLFEDIIKRIKMKFGINTFLFASPFTGRDIVLFPRFREWGFDSVEIALEDPRNTDIGLIKEALDNNGLICGSVCAAMGPGHDLRGSEKEQQRALDFFKDVLDRMPALDCPVLAGPLYSAVGRAEPVEKNEYKKQWDTVVAHLRHLSEYAAGRGARLAIEAINRYETDFINTAAQAMQMVEDVGHEAFFVHLDSYHMNIEEKDPAGAILHTGNKLGHFHACGTDRGTPGGDETDWRKIVSALKKINYNGTVVIESFTTDVKVIARAASVWRNVEPSREDIAVKGLQFLKSAWEEN